MTARTARLARCLLAFGLLAALTACGTGPRKDSVTVMVPWSGPEFDAFYKVVERFGSRTGIQVNVQVTRALDRQLHAAVAAGHPPDLAVLPSVGAIDRYTSKPDLQPLDVDPAAYREPFRDLMGTRKVYAVPVKADVKSLIWYDPVHTPEPPVTTTPGLRALSRDHPGLWCLGLESGPTSGWPGADWISDILLAAHGPSAYERWLTGGQSWSSSAVRDAWTDWLGLVGGSTARATATAFGDAARGMTASSPTCRLDHGALAAMAFSSGLRAGRDYAYAPVAPGAPLEVSADFVGMFAAHNPSARELITYLSGKDAQTTWVGARGGFAFSADSQVPSTAYPAGVERDIAALLRPDSGHALCYSAADTMRPDLSAAFYRAVLDYVRDPGAVTGILKGLDETQKAVHASPVPRDKICSNAP
jgi:alpha-glucoside transport system substrate-binding protein